MVMVLDFVSLEQVRYPIVAALPPPRFNGDSIVPGVINEEVTTPWHLGDERRGPGYSWNYWCQDDKPLFFGTPDEGFAVGDAKEVILKVHRHIIKTTQERYRMPVELKTRLIYEDRCDERLKARVKLRNLHASHTLGCAFPAVIHT
jgi:hypothetical protein